MSSKIQVLCSLFLVTAFSCKSPNADEIPPLSPDMSQPIATGIYVTNSMGPDPIAVWGNPSDGFNTVSVDDNLFYSNSRKNIDTISVLKSVSPVSLKYLIPTRVMLDLPYPNPFMVTCTIEFALPVQSNVVLYIVPARWLGDKSNDISLETGAVTAAPKRTAIAILKRDQLSAGIYQFQWQNSSLNGNPFPAGFYRIYLHAYSTLYNIFYWHDVFLYNKISNLPVGLR